MRFKIKSVSMVVLSILLLCSLASAEIKRVIRGTDGWLYFIEEWTSQPKREKESVESIIQIVNAFKTKNVPVIVSLTPAKSRIYPENLRPEDIQSRDIQYKYARTIFALKRADIPVVDLYPLFFKESHARQSSNFPIYLRQDSHWSNTGGLLAGQKVGQFISEHYAKELENISEQNFELQPLPVTQKLGDLVKFLPGTEQQNFQPEECQSYELNLTGESAGDALLTESQPEIFVAGTSYSLPGTGFEDGIKLSVSKDTTNYSLDGQGQWEPIRQFLKDAIEQKYQPKLVVWEIPERFLYYTPPTGVLSEILENIHKLPAQN
jgi:alginate O-acetyltransferase complex protein AlgJ